MLVGWFFGPAGLNLQLGNFENPPPSVFECSISHDTGEISTHIVHELKTRCRVAAMLVVSLVDADELGEILACK